MAEQYWYPGSGLSDTSFTSGPTNAGWQPHNFNYGNVITVGGSAGTATVISARVDTGGFGAIDLKIGLYNSSGSLQAQGLINVPNGTTGTWRDISISAALSPGTFYVLCSAATTNIRHYYNTGIVGKYATNNYAASMPASAGTIGDEAALGYAVRVYVVESGGGGSSGFRSRVAGGFLLN